MLSNENRFGRRQDGTIPGARPRAKHSGRVCPSRMSEAVWAHAQTMPTDTRVNNRQLRLQLSD